MIKSKIFTVLLWNSYLYNILIQLCYRLQHFHLQYIIANLICLLRKPTYSLRLNSGASTTEINWSFPNEIWPQHQWSDRVNFWYTSGPPVKSTVIWKKTKKNPSNKQLILLVVQEGYLQLYQEKVQNWIVTWMLFKEFLKNLG